MAVPQTAFLKTDLRCRCACEHVEKLIVHEYWTELLGSSSFLRLYPTVSYKSTRKSAVNTIREWAKDADRQFK